MRPVKGRKDQFIERLLRPLRRRESVWISAAPILYSSTPSALRLVASTHDDFAFSHAFKLLSFQGLSCVLGWHVTQKKYVVRLRRQHQTETLDFTAG